MLLSPCVFRLVSIRTIEKEGKSFTFVRFANTETFETNDFMLHRDLKPADYSIGLDYEILLDVDGKFLNVVDMTPKSLSANAS